MAKKRDQYNAGDEAGGQLDADKADQVVQENKAVATLKAALSKGVNLNNVLSSLGIDNIQAESMNPSQVIDKISNLVGSGDIDLQSVTDALGVNNRNFTTKQLARAEPYTFERLVIPHSEVRTKTKIALNPRSYQNLRPADVQDILETIEDGQDEEAVAYIDPDDGLIAIVDGSRREFSTQLAGVDFAVYVTNEVLTRADVNRLNKKKTSVELTTVERGRDYLAIMEEQGFTQQQQLVDYLQAPKSTVSEAISLASVGDDLMTLAYAPTRLGAGLIKKLKALGQKYDNQQLEKIREHAENFIKFNTASFSEISLSECNKRVVNEITAWATKEYDDNSASVQNRAAFTPITKFKFDNLEGSVEVKKSDSNKRNTSLHFKINNAPLDKRDEFENEFNELVKKYFDTENSTA